MDGADEGCRLTNVGLFHELRRLPEKHGNPIARKHGKNPIHACGVFVWLRIPDQEIACIVDSSTRM
jgi:hypothetical protein